MILVKSLVWMIVSTALELFCALFVSLFLLGFLELSGVTALASLTYWNLYWIQMALYSAVGSAVVMGITAVEFMGS